MYMQYKILKCTLQLHNYGKKFIITKLFKKYNVKYYWIKY